MSDEGYEKEYVNEAFDTNWIAPLGENVNKFEEELASYFVNLGYKTYKATQVYEWLYEKRVKSFDEMTNIKKDVIEILKKDYY